jgi:hypothetical protein
MPKKKKIFEELDQYDYIDEDFIGEASPDYIESIGLFILEFSALEHSINLHIAEVISHGSHFIGYQVIELLQMRNKIDLLSRMAGAYLFFSESKKKPKFDKVVEKIKELNSFRNKVVHANWLSAAKDGTVRTRIIVDEEDATIKFERAKINPTIIFKKSEECSLMREKLDELFEEIGLS